MEKSYFIDELNKTSLDIPRTALAFARSIAYPSLDIEDYLNRLDIMVEQARRSVLPYPLIDDRIDALSE